MCLADKIGDLTAQVGSKLLHPNITEFLKGGNLLSDNHGDYFTNPLNKPVFSAFHQVLYLLLTKVNKFVRSVEVVTGTQVRKLSKHVSCRFCKDRTFSICMLSVYALKKDI